VSSRWRSHNLVVVPVRKTKRGAERTPLTAEADVLVCGASFAGLAVARELAGSGERVMVIDRYEIGERQTSACAAPTGWLERLGLGASIRQTFDQLVVHTPHGTARPKLPWTLSTFDYRVLCELLAAQGDFEFETVKVDGRAAASTESVSTGAVTITTDRGDLSAPLVVDALGWRRVLSNDPVYQPPDAPLSRGLEVHPNGSSGDLEVWIDRRYVPAGYGWSFPAHDELRVGVGSFDPRFHVKDTTVLLADDLELPAIGYQGNWIPHRLRKATEPGPVFFAGDSAGHCLPLTAEGIRTAFYFGIALGRELRAVADGKQSRATAAERYDRFNEAHRWKFEKLLKGQRLLPRIHPRLLPSAFGMLSRKVVADWAFEHYLRIAPPEFVGPPPGAPRSRGVRDLAAVQPTR
jgi:flavin-dependent dehydrogenase